MYVSILIYKYWIYLPVFQNAPFIIYIINNIFTYSITVSFYLKAFVNNKQHNRHMIQINFKAYYKIIKCTIQILNHGRPDVEIMKKIIKARKE